MPDTQSRRSIAYFSMEIALESDLPTYSGGLGVLAGDTLRSCADLALPVCAVTLVHHKGYFLQSISARGEQREDPQVWSPEKRLEALGPRVHVKWRGKQVALRAFCYRIWGAGGAQVPVYLLDADLPENDAENRRLTDRLYGGDEGYRLGQELLLGVGGVRMLRALGHRDIARFHLNEGHAALAIPELCEELEPNPEGDVGAALAAVRARCVFTTHTPVPAGHDRFPPAIWKRALSKGTVARLARLGARDELDMTQVALAGSAFVNGVAMRHAEVSREMFPGHPIRAITNGVHLPTWASPSFRELFDRHLPHWRSDAYAMRHAVGIPGPEIEAAHAAAKRRLIELVAERTGQSLDPQALTLGFGRRMTAYKRATLVLRDPAALRRIAERAGPLQIVYGGKAHPHDQPGRRLIREIYEAAQTARGALQIAFVPGYDMDVCGTLVAGCDVWLNTPVPPLEASGTSGMKAALNGIPSLSILDGWWVEGCAESATGWAVGGDREGENLPAERRDALHARALYAALEETVAPCFYHDRERFVAIMRQAIAINASYFNTQRMVQEYYFEAWGQGRAAARSGGGSG